MKKAKPINLILILAFLTIIAGCSAMPRSGPMKSEVLNAPKSKLLEGIVVVEVNDALVKKLRTQKKIRPFSKVFGSENRPSYPIRPGDSLEISIWETPPSILFGGISLDPKTSALNSRAENLPPQMVMDDGKINMPFVGRVPVAGKTLQNVEADIQERLQGKANNPQVMVRLVRNPSSHVNVIGDVKQNINLPLTPKGEKVLDALASAGGVSQTITKMSLQLARQGKVATMPLDRIVKTPRENIWLMPGDVLTAMFQPWTFTVLGATGKNDEIPFETNGISLAQALARAGGLHDQRADPGAVFLFRFESPKVFEGGNLTYVNMNGKQANTDQMSTPATLPLTEDGKVPVVYQFKFDDAATFLLTQNFPMQDKDVLYAANATAAQLQKFLSMVGIALSPVASWYNLLQYRY